jgi:hypothetical protein
MKIIDWHWPTALIALVFVLFIAAILLFILIRKASNISALKILISQDGESVREGLKIILMAIATAIGGIWVVYGFVVTGAAKMSELQLNKAKWESLPGPEISSLTTEAMPYAQSDAAPKYALHIEVEIVNNGYQDFQFPLQEIPLLLIAKVKKELTGKDVELDDSKNSIFSPPFFKIEDLQGNRSIKKWNTIILEPGGKQKFSFLQPSLDAGIYYIQFQIMIPEEVAKTTINLGTSKDTDKTKPFFAAQNAYVRIPSVLDNKGTIKETTLEIQKPRKSKPAPE